ncbi:hypothetical protein [Cognatishimia sp.]|uniref:hypothetical protein n=1 Tax=Cognatishimia sp. TaxID=2211648 RepID=UPI00351693C1
MSFFSIRKPVGVATFQSSRPAKSRAPDALEQLVIFIGHHKVGSTSLQDYFARNMLHYAQQGILYPYVEFEGAAHMASQSLHAASPVRLSLNVREPHNALAFTMLAQAGARRVPDFLPSLPSLKQMHHALRQQLHHLRPHTAVLVSEVFANFGADAPDLAAELASLFPARNVILYGVFRPIDEYLVAWYGQRLKFGHALQPLRTEGASEYAGTIHFDYRKVLNGWRAAFPKAKVILRDYQDLCNSGGIVPDFLADTGLPQGRHCGTRRMNVSLHPALYEIQRRGNLELPPKRAARLRALLVSQTPSLNLPGCREIEMFGAQRRRDIIQQFDPVTRALGDWVGRAEFFQDLKRRTRVRPIPELEAFKTALDRLGDTLPEDTPPDVVDFLSSLNDER